MTTLSFVLSPPSPPDTHVLPINATTINNDGFLFSAGRDGSIVQHHHHSNDHHEFHIQLHSDWINDITAISSSTVVSGSSDQTVKYWSPESDSHGLIGYHSDYVKSVTSFNSKVFSAGLDSLVKVWDVNKCVEINKWLNKGFKSSIYSIKSNSNGLLSIGDLNGNLNILDHKSMTIVNTFKAHDDVIKTMLINDNYLLSGSSDSYIKLFDLRNLSAEVNQYKFNDSIWCLSSNDDSFAEFYHGDSKGGVYHTVNNGSELIHNEFNGILSISNWNNEIFISSMKNSNLTNLNDKQSSIEGEPGLIRCQMLNNRRHVITLSTCNEIMLWDILNLKMIKSFGTDIEFDEILSKYQTNEILNSWCRITIKSGKLFIILSELNWNDCEVYGDLLNDYDFSAALDGHTRYSLGKIFLLSIFQQLINFETNNDKLYKDEKIKESKSTKKSKDDDKKFNFFSKKKQSIEPVINTNDEDYSETAYQTILDIKQQYSSISPANLSSISLYSIPSDPYILSIQNLKYSEKEQIQLIISKKIDNNNNNGSIDIYSEDLNTIIINNSLKPILSHHSSVNINEDYPLLEKKLPIWIGDFLFRNKFVIKDTPKVGFIISKDPNDATIPSLKKLNPNDNELEMRLNAYGMLRIRKVLPYIFERLNLEEFDDLNVDNVEDWLELVCVDEVLDNDLTLATLRSFVWKRGGDVKLLYRRKK